MLTVALNMSLNGLLGIDTVIHAISDALVNRYTVYRPVYKFGKIKFLFLRSSKFF